LATAPVAELVTLPVACTPSAVTVTVIVFVISSDTKVYVDAVAPPIGEPPRSIDT